MTRIPGKLINICGASHSGTTMLDLMLGNRPDSFSTGEIYAWYRPWRTQHYRIECSCGQEPCTYWKELAEFPEIEFHRAVLSLPNIEYVVDSSKDIAWIIDNNTWNRQAGISVVNLLVWKKPISLAHSYWKRGWAIENSLVNFHKYYRNFFRAKLPTVSIDYHDMVDRPSVKLQHICRALGMTYFEGMHKFWQGKHHFLFGSGGVRTQVSQRKGKILVHEELPEEFEQEFGQIYARFRHRHDIDNLLTRLSAIEISFLPESEIDKILNNPYAKSLFHPRFYFASWLRRNLKRRLPKKWPPEVQ